MFFDFLKASLKGMIIAFDSRTFRLMAYKLVFSIIVYWRYNQTTYITVFSIAGVTLVYGKG